MMSLKMESRTPLIELLDGSGALSQPRDDFLKTLETLIHRQQRKRPLQEENFQQELESRTLQMMDVMIYGLMIVFALLAYRLYRIR